MNFVFYSIQYIYTVYISIPIWISFLLFPYYVLYGNFTCHNSLVISLLFLPAQFFSLSCSCLLSLLFMSHCILPVISIIFMYYVYICHHSVWSAVTLDNTVLSLTCQSFLGSSFKCLLWLSGWHLYFFLSKLNAVYQKNIFSISFLHCLMSKMFYLIIFLSIKLYLILSTRPISCITKTHSLIITYPR